MARIISLCYRKGENNKVENDGHAVKQNNARSQVELQLYLTEFKIQYKFNV